MIPSLATLANAGAGVVACALAIEGRPELAALMILAAVIFDSVDGVLARSLQAASRLGAQLDSMADLISFGMAPAIVIGSLLPSDSALVGWVLLIVFPLGAAWRLARFNVSNDAGAESHREFCGLPTTGAGAAAATAVLLLSELKPLGVTVEFLCILACGLGLLMVSGYTYAHSSAVLGRMSTRMVAEVGIVLVGLSMLFGYEYVVAMVTWGYALSAPVISATLKFFPVGHAHG
jgi:CDP-diacylglycerol--serine O-phosphatidyltransferase